MFGWPVFTMGGMVALIVIYRQMTRLEGKDSEREFNPDSRTLFVRLLKECRQELRLMGVLLAGILIMLGIIADRV